MSEIKLKPCPFCGEELVVIDDGQYYAHKINGCIFQHLCFETYDEEAIKQWNTRKPMERIVERLEGEIELVVTQFPLQGNYIKKTRAIEIVKEEGGVCQETTDK